MSDIKDRLGKCWCRTCDSEYIGGIDLTDIFLIETKCKCQKLYIADPINYQ